MRRQATWRPQLEEVGAEEGGAGAGAVAGRAGESEGAAVQPMAPVLLTSGCLHGARPMSADLPMPHHLGHGLFNFITIPSSRETDQSCQSCLHRDLQPQLGRGKVEIIACKQNYSFIKRMEAIHLHPLLALLAVALLLAVPATSMKCYHTGLCSVGKLHPFVGDIETSKGMMQACPCLRFASTACQHAFHSCSAVCSLHTALFALVKWGLLVEEKREQRLSWQWRARAACSCAHLLCWLLLTGLPCSPSLPGSSQPAQLQEGAHHPGYR